MENILIIIVVDDCIQLKQLVAEDAVHYFNLVDKNRGHLSQFGDETAKKYESLEQVSESIINPKNKSRLRFGIWVKDVFVGTINLTLNEDTKGNPIAEIGYLLGECYQGKGYIGKSLARLIQYAFHEMDIQMVYAEVENGNERSVNVLTKAGFQEDYPLENKRLFYLERN